MDYVHGIVGFMRQETNDLPKRISNYSYNSSTPRKDTMKREQLLMSTMTDKQLDHARRLINKEFNRRTALASSGKSKSKSRSRSAAATA